MTIDIRSQDFFIYVPDREKIYETPPFVDVPSWARQDELHTQTSVVDESWVKIPLQDRLVVYARLGNDAEA